MHTRQSCSPSTAGASKRFPRRLSARPGRAPATRCTVSRQDLRQPSGQILCLTRSWTLAATRTTATMASKRATALHAANCAAI